MSKPPFKIGKLTPPAPDGIWDRPDSWGVEVPNEMWLLEIDCTENIGSCKRHLGMIEVRGDSEELVTFLAEQILSKLNDPKVQFISKLKVG